VRAKRLADPRTVRTLQEDAEKLHANVRELAAAIGWDAADPELGLALIRRTLSYLPRYRGATPEAIDADARLKRDAIRDNLNGGFGELRLLVRDELIDEANVQNIRVGEGIGFETVIDLQPEDLLQYLLQLELVARIVHYAIDARADAIEDLRIETRKDIEVIPGAHPDFLREYPVQVRFRCSKDALARILNRLDAEAPAVPLRDLRIDRSDRPLNHVVVHITALAVATSTEVPFDAPPEEKAQ
jgi:hypothetical protein